ncbi:MAG: type IX secretion system membrane protein PorP/SprF, partial [Bacteroidota bacterium]
MGQDPAFAQYFANKLYLNPAFAGFDPGLNVYSALRNQWMGLDGGNGRLLTQNVGASLELPRLMSGFGVHALDNVEGTGDLRWRSLELQYAFRTRTCSRFRNGSGKFQLPPDLEFSLGLGMSYNQWQLINPSGLIFSDQIDPLTGFTGGNTRLPSVFRDGPQANFVDFTAGALFDYAFGASASNNWRKPWVAQVGMAFRHLNRTNGQPAGDLRPTRFTTHGMLIYQGIYEQRFTAIFTARRDWQASFSLPGESGRSFVHNQLGAVALLGDEPGIWTGLWWQGRASKIAGTDSSRNLNSLVTAIGGRIPMERIQRGKSSR